ncbi:MAG: HK97 family phage prohead protease [Gemmatimonadota bacterium]|nr:MAG: HK97 family phage prohead protease [Gemmatimonadota bacterium]
MRETRYFRPDLGLCTRTATGLEQVDANPDTDNYRSVTHLRAVPLGETAVTGRTLEGIFSPFNVETTIDSWHEGTFREVFRRGAFTRTLTEDRQIVQFEHGMSLITDSLPLGPIDQLTETDQGLYMRATLRNTPRVDEIREAIADGTVSGGSIQFRVREETITRSDDDDGLDLREVTDVRLFELGPVVWPAYPTTQIQVANMVPTVEPLPDGTGMGSDVHLTNDDVRRAAKAARLRLLLT